MPASASPATAAVQVRLSRQPVTACTHSDERQQDHAR